MRRFDPPMTDAERWQNAKRYTSQAQGVTASGKRRRKRGELTEEAERARKRVARAVASGRLVKPTACPSCGRTDQRIEFAHNSYGGDGLDGRWLCESEHRREDRLRPKGGTR